MAKTKTEVALPGLSGLAGAVKRTRATIPTAGGKSYLRFAKDGDWVFGKDSVSVFEETLLINPLTLKSGYVCWTNYDAKEKRKNQKLGEEMAPIATGVDPGSLPDLGWDWRAQFAVEGRFVTGDMEECVYNTSSGGGADAFDTLLEALEERLDSGELAYVFPAVKLVEDSYEHAQWGKTYKPVLELIGWGNVEGDIIGLDEAAPEPDEAPEPEESDDDAPQGEPESGEEAADEPAPTQGRRRRRRAA